MATTTIPVSALNRVLEGVVVATKAPDSYAQIVTKLLRQYGVVRGHDSPMSVAEDALPADTIHNFDEWRAILEERPEWQEEGVRQLLQVILAVSLLRERSRRDLELDSSTLDTIWDLVYRAITTSEATLLKLAVSRSAQGFLAVPLCSLLSNGKIDELWRFHTWVPDGQRGINEKVSIHAHQPFAQSWTLLGSGTDCTFDVDTPEDESLTTHSTYECCWASADGKQTGSGYQTHQISSTIRSTGRFLRVVPRGVFPHSRDMSYSVPAGAYHRSIVPPWKLHATLFVFDAERGYDHNAAVLGPKDGGEFVQLRDAGGITAVALAEMANAMRKWEQTNEMGIEVEIENTMDMAYYRFFRGLALVRAGNRDEAMQYLDPEDGFTPLHAFSSESTPKHRDYIRQLLEVGVHVAVVDHTGRTALDYAKAAGDLETTTLLEVALQVNEAA